MSPRVMLVEDNMDDAALVRAVLERHFPGMELHHVHTRAMLDRLLEQPPVDIIVSDHGVPGCEGMDVLHLTRARAPGTPFVSLTGAAPEAWDLHGLRGLGVSGFLTKARLEELAPLVERLLAPRGVPPAQDTLLRGYDRLVGVVKELSLAPDLPGVMRVVRQAARQLTGAAGATFVLREGTQCHYADEDAIGPLWKGQRFPMESCVSGWAMMHRQPAVVEDIFEDPRIPVHAYEPTFVRSVVMVPIRAMDPLGAIGTYWPTRRLPDPTEVRLIQALADTTAVAMENIRVRAQLEQRVAERTADLEAFTYGVSHDLRAPIRHVLGYARMMREEQPALSPAQLGHLERMEAAATRMEELTQGLLRLSQASRAPVQRQPVDLAALARDVAAECAAATPHRVEVVVPASLPALGDATLLRNVLHNLLGNAFKFTRHATAPRVELGVHHTPQHAPVYFVRDNGAGFTPPAPPAPLFGVFQRFHRQQDFPGTGVGLATVRRILANHGGALWVESAPNAGATFFFTLQPA